MELNEKVKNFKIIIIFSDSLFAFGTVSDSRTNFCLGSSLSCVSLTLSTEIEKTIYNVIIILYQTSLLSPERYFGESDDISYLSPDSTAK